MRQRRDAPPRPENGVCTVRGLAVQRILAPECGVLMGLQAVYDWLHRLDSSSLWPRPHHEDSLPTVQEVFKAIVVEPIEAIAAEHPDQAVRLDFEDAARFGPPGTITRVWAPPGSRPRAVRPNGREWWYVLVAVCVSPGATSALLMPEWNTEVINRFLEQFARELPAGVDAVLIWEGAGDHTGGDLVVPSTVSVILLPADSPELNPVENLWHDLRAHHWSNRPYGDDDALESEAIRSLCTVWGDAEKHKSICNTDYVRGSA